MMGELILAYSPRVEPTMAGKVQKEHEVADHIASTVRKWTAMHAGAQELHRAHRKGISTLRWVFPPQLTQYRQRFHKQVQTFVP